MSKTADTKGGTIVTSPMTDVSATSLFHALSEIEQFSAAEMRTPLPEGSVPMLPRLSFLDVGFKNGAITTIITFLLTPISMAAIDNLVPVFGNREPDLIDSAFIYSFASALAVAFSLLIASVSAKTYRGRITKTLINGLLFSYATAKIFLSLFLVAVTYFIYSKVLTPQFIYSIADTVQSVVSFLSKGAKTQTMESVYYFLIYFRETTIKAAKFATLLHVGTATLLLVSHIIGIRRTKKIELLRKEWE